MGCWSKRTRKAYFELLDQPAIIIPYTPKEETAKINVIPIFKSANTDISWNGITAHEKKLNNKVLIGAIINIIKLDGLVLRFL